MTLSKNATQESYIGEKLLFRGHVTSARQIGARTLITREIGLGFGDGLGLWLGFWVMVLE